MSQQEYHEGTAIEVAKDVKGFVDKIYYLRDNEGLDVELLIKNHDLYLDEEEYINYDSGYLYLRGVDKMFKFLKHTEYDYERDVSEGKLNPDGSIDFTLSFYNGGCSLGEAFESAFTKLPVPLSKEVLLQYYEELFEGMDKTLIINYLVKNNIKI